MKTIVITGSSKGIGFHLANEFLQRNCQVVISSRSLQALKLASSQLINRNPQAQLLSSACDVTDYSQVMQLWKTANNHFGNINIWINNAGQGHAQNSSWLLPENFMEGIVQSNILGVMYGSKVAMQGMLTQGFGAIYNMEGLGSDGRIVEGLAIYGTSKAAVHYFTRSLMKEAVGTPIIVGALSPGMVMTDLITQQYTSDPEAWAKAKPIFNILADRPETVTAWMVPQILANQQNGKSIAWLTQTKILARFIGSVFHKRNIAP